MVKLLRKHYVSYINVSLFVHLGKYCCRNENYKKAKMFSFELYCINCILIVEATVGFHLFPSLTTCFQQEKHCVLN